MGRIISSSVKSPMRSDRGPKGMQPQNYRNDMKLQETRKTQGSSDIVNENINQGYGKGSKLKVAPTKQKFTLKVKR